MVSFINKTFTLNPYISVAEYFNKSGQLSIFICNEKSGYSFLLEGETAEFWSVIFKSNCNIDEIAEFVSKNNIQDVNSFLDDLYDADLIRYSEDEFFEDDLFFYDSKLLLNSTSNEVDEFEREKKTFLFENNFLYSLRIEVPSEIVNIEQYFSIIDDAQKIGVNVITLFLNDFLLNDNFFILANYIRKKFISLQIEASGEAYFDTENLLEKILPLYPHRLFIPLHSMDEKVHNNISQSNCSFEKTIKIIKKLSLNFLPVTVFYKNKSYNKQEFQNISKFVSELQNVELSCSKEVLSFSNNLTQVFTDDYLSISSHNTSEVSNKAKQKLFISKELNLYADYDYNIYLSDLNKLSLVDFWINLL